MAKTYAFEIASNKSKELVKVGDKEFRADLFSAS